MDAAAAKNMKSSSFTPKSNRRIRRQTRREVQLIDTYQDPCPLSSETSGQLVEVFTNTCGFTINDKAKKCDSTVPFSKWEKVHFHLSRTYYRKVHSIGKLSSKIQTSKRQTSKTKALKILSVY